MARRYKLITELYERTQKSVAAPDKWQEFLSSACQNYKLPFDEQLLIGSALAVDSPSDSEVNQ